MNIFSKGQVIVKTALIFLIIVSSCGEKDNPTPQNNDPIITEKGTPTGQLVSASIGTSGGSLQSVDGKIKVEIPSGALSATTTVSIQPISNEAPLGLGLGYRLLPEGTIFSKPAKIVFQYDDQVLDNAIEDFLWIVTQAADGSWGAKLNSDVDTNANTVSVETTHFSDWSVGTFTKLTLTPSSSTLMVNKSLDLKIDGFAPDELGPDDLVPLIPLPADGSDMLTPLTRIPKSVPERIQSFRVVGWKLNGSPSPISNSNGSLSASGTSSTFKAPAQKPSANPVAVSVELEGSNKEGTKIKYLLNSNIKIVDSELYAVLTVDGQTFEYTQYGFNGTVPPSSGNFNMVNAGISDHYIGIVAMQMTNGGTTAANSFILAIENPVKGSSALKCAYQQSYDDFTYTKDPSSPQSAYRTVYDRREKNGDVCDIEYSCGSFYVILSEVDTKVRGVIAGTFAGEVYEDKAAYEDQCKTPDKHNVTGEFRIVLAN